MHLVVIVPFESYERGERIENEEDIRRILASEQAHFVARFARPEKTEE